MSILEDEPESQQLRNRQCMHDASNEHEQRNKNRVVQRVFMLPSLERHQK